jgi:hypothetical protein
MYSRGPRSETLPIDNRASPAANVNHSRRQSIAAVLYYLLYIITSGRLSSHWFDRNRAFPDSMERNPQVSGSRGLSRS